MICSTHQRGNEATSGLSRAGQLATQRQKAGRQGVQGGWYQLNRQCLVGRLARLTATCWIDPHGTAMSALAVFTIRHSWNSTSCCLPLQRQAGGSRQQAAGGQQGGWTAVAAAWLVSKALQRTVGSGTSVHQSRIARPPGKRAPLLPPLPGQESPRLPEHGPRG